MIGSHIATTRYNAQINDSPSYVNVLACKCNSEGVKCNSICKKTDWLERCTEWACDAWCNLDVPTCKLLDGSDINEQRISCNNDYKAYCFNAPCKCSSEGVTLNGKTGDYCWLSEDRSPTEC